MTRILTAFVTAISLGVSFQQAGVQTDRPAKVDAVFARWSTSTPGCAVGVAENGRNLLERAYGMADLEHDVPNSPETIFEAGSVSKQFTAAAVLLLAKEGKLSIDDPVRTYVPELPDYGKPLTIRHMLTHTSGLRDWGSVAAIGGWPRSTRAYTHGHVLDIVSRQKALNFDPGSNWSYCNSGYNLAAIIVSRVSGQSFADFSRDRLFRPLGMTRTSWRDDFKRIVKHRAIAYEPAGDGYREDMPFENVHGNGGLLTTVIDLLKWNDHLDNPKLWDATFSTLQETPVTLTDGRQQVYAFGLYVRPYRGVREVSHSGSTAGYSAFLTRFPVQRLSVAVLCNVAGANATQFAHAVAEAYMGSRFSEPVATSTAGGRGGTAGATAFRPAEADLRAYLGRYASDEAETEFTAVLDGDTIALKQRPDRTIRLRPTDKDVFAAGGLGTITFRRGADGRVSEFSVRQDRVWDLRFHLVRFPQ